MKQIKIFTDTCSDITEDIRKKRDIVSIDFTIFINDKEISADPWKNISPTELYETLQSGERVYTLPATENEIRTKFKKYVKDFDILYVAACEKQSTTIVKARRIAEELMNEDSEINIVIVDSLNASIGQKILVEKACDYRDEGLTINEIAEKVSKIRNNVIQFATVDTLTYLSKANKINARSAIFGDLFDIKPILISDAEGKQTALSRIRGRVNSLHEIIRLFLENIVNPEEQEIFIIHGNEILTAKGVEKELIKLGLKCKKINILCVGPVVGVTTGPGMIGLFGLGKEVTFVGD